jgi:hypothetical protein
MQRFTGILFCLGSLMVLPFLGTLSLNNFVLPIFALGFGLGQIIQHYVVDKK